MNVRNHSFSHDFHDDLAQFDLFDPQPFAFARFGDGELGIVNGDALKNCDGWFSGKTPADVRRALRDAATCDATGWHVGIPCPCCDPDGRDFWTNIVGVPEERRTFANIFVNANWPLVMQRARDEKWFERCVLVGPFAQAQVKIPGNWTNRPDALNLARAIADNLITGDKPILVCAGPMAKILIHLYWTSVLPWRRHTIVDCGSIFDPCLLGKRNRGYQWRNHTNSYKICQWTQRRTTSACA